MSRATEKNILAIKKHSEDTRDMLRIIESGLSELKSINSKISLMEQQIKAIQVKLYSGGATNGDNN